MSTRTLSSETIFTGRVFTVQRDRVRLPHGPVARMDVIRHPASVVLLPMPLNAQCNEHVRSEAAVHANACQLTKLALGVWLADPQQFEAYHHWLFEPTTARATPDARLKANELVGAAQMDEALSHMDRIDAQIKASTDWYAATGGNQVPKMFIGQEVINGSGNSADALFKLIEQSTSLKPVE